MIPAKPVVVVAMLALAGVAATQEKADEQRVAELLDLLDRETGDEWIWNTPEDLLVEMGSPIVPTLLRFLDRALEDGDNTRVKGITALLGNMGPDAADAWPALRDMVPTIDEDSLGAVLMALSDLAPYKQVTAAGAERILMKVLSRGSPARFAQEHFIRMLERSQLVDASTDTDQLLLKLNEERGFVKAVAAELLGQREVEVDAVLASLRRGLEIPMKAWFANRPGQRSIRRSQEMRTLIYRDEIEKITESMLKIEPRDPRTAVAHGFMLVGHSDPSVRMTSAITIGSFESHGADAIPFLLDALSDEKAQVARASITALGMIGPAAKDAIPTLEKLTEDKDKQIAERAKAALRQIRRSS